MRTRRKAAVGEEADAADGHAAVVQRSGEEEGGRVRRRLRRGQAPKARFVSQQSSAIVHPLYDCRAIGIDDNQHNGGLARVHKRNTICMEENIPGGFRDE